MKALVDVDDLWNIEQIEQYLKPLSVVSGFRVTCYTIPNKFGEVTDFLRERYPFIIWGIHGFEHTHAECLEWTKEKAVVLLDLALEMGYDPVFKPPNWLFDRELVAALSFMKEAGKPITLHLNEKETPLDVSFPVYYGKGPDHEFIHTHITANPVTDFIETHPKFQPHYLRQFRKFLSPIDVAALATGESS